MSLLPKETLKQYVKEKRDEMGDNFDAELNLALFIASNALFEKKLWSGRDYLVHPMFVGMHKTDSAAKQTIGILHDVLEDSDWTEQDLRDCGFSERVISGVVAVTKRDDEQYLDFIVRCGRNADAIDVKIADLSHNMDLSRGGRMPDDKILERMQKYHLALEYLVAIKKGDNTPGTSMADFVAKREDLNGTKIVAGLLARHTASPAPMQIRLPFPKAAP
jgi:(p)ppGpp synthase/HD superfamily hydrolase